jgi:hypothetical protein
MMLMVLGRRLHDQGRVELLQNVSIPLQQQSEELENVVRDKVMSIPLRTPANSIVSCFGSKPTASLAGRM